MNAAPLSVVTAVSDRWESGVVSVLTRAPGIEVVRRCVDLPDLLAVAASGVADVVIVSAGLRGLDLSAVRDLTDVGCRVVAVLDPSGGEDEERRVRQLGVQDAVLATAPGPELVEVVRSARQPPAAMPVPVRETEPQPPAEEPEPDRTSGTVVTVWGTGGAPGRTTTAVTVAAELAAEGHEVLLVDADTYGASVAPVLGLLDEAAGLATACRAAEQGVLDVTALARIAPSVEARLRVLTGLPRPDRWTEIRPAALERVLSVARLLVDVVVVDVGAPLEDDEELSYDTRAPRRNMAALTCVDEADLVVVVGAADPIGLTRLVRSVDDLAAREREPGHVVVTKVRRSATGPGAARQVTEVLDRYLPAAARTLVPWGLEVLDAALLAGRPVGAVAPSAPVRVALRDLARHLGPVR